MCLTIFHSSPLNSYSLRFISRFPVIESSAKRYWCHWEIRPVNKNVDLVERWKIGKGKKNRNSPWAQTTIHVVWAPVSYARWCCRVVVRKVSWMMKNKKRKNNGNLPGRLLPLSHIAETVKWVGLTRRQVKFQPKVIGSPDAILKNELAVCGGWVMVRPPTGAVAEMIRTEEELELVEADENVDVAWHRRWSTFGNICIR